MPKLPEVDELVAYVAKRAPSRDPLARVTIAAKVGADLSHRADTLVDHYVRAARDAGVSWAQIGEGLGVTKQAAQQRFVSRAEAAADGDTDARYTPRARRALVRASREARRLGHNYVGTEHLLLALLATGGVAATVLREIAPLTELRAAVLAQTAPRVDRRDRTEARSQLTRTPLARRAIEQAAAESTALGHAYLGTEHLLLGVAAVAEGVGAQVLAGAGATLDSLRGRVVERLSGYSGEPGLTQIVTTEPRPVKD